MNLESKLLDGKCAGYCSSSEGEEDEGGFKVAKDDDEHQANVMRRMGTSGNTGPKGVMKDFHEFREQMKLDREARDRAVLKEAQRGMLQGRKEDRERAQQLNSSDDEDDDLDRLRKRRLQELRKVAVGRIVEVTEKDQYTQAIDGCRDSLLCVLIYEPDVEACERMTEVCKILAAEHSNVKFIRARSTLLGMTKQFTAHALPTLQFYLNSNLIGNFVKMDSVLGSDFGPDTVRKYLRSQHISLRTGGYTTDSDISSDNEDID